MKWDLILDNSSNGLVVKDLHLTPISNNIPYTYQSEEYLLNNTHEDNVKSYYKSMEGAFYSDGVNPEFKHNWPMVVPAGTHAYTYNDMYDMGCRRMKHYDIYKKQFEFFCPVWLEYLDADLTFKFSVRDSIGVNTISQRTLTIKRTEITDKFNKYFIDYATNCGIVDGTDDVMMIDISNGNAFATGLNVKTGLHTVRDINNVINIITSRERPLMEFDNILISNLSNNGIIVNQLFNFNFCFNLNDIISGAIGNLVNGEHLSVAVDVYIGDTHLEKRDFDTEYDYIPKQVIYNDGTLNEDINVLNYLIDYKCIDIVGTNKYSQQICHWSICDCNDYIFNLYNGFSGYSISKGDVIQSNHQYGKTPSLDTIGHSNFTNNTGWLNITSFKEWADFYVFMMDISDKKDMMSVFYDKHIVNDIKYTKTSSKPIYFYGIHVSSNLFTKIANNYDHINLYGNMIVIPSGDIILFVSDNLDEFTHRTIRDGLKSVDVTDPLINSFIDIFMSYVTPSVITLTSSLVAERVPGPTHMTDEMTYYKDNYHSEYVIRYDGKIKPTFVTRRTLYYKDYVSDDRSNGTSKLQMSPYGHFVITGYEPLFKSIGYYSILSTEMDYVNVPKVSYTEHNDVSLIQTPEYKWFNNGWSIGVKDEHNFVLVKKADDNLETMICDYLKRFYKVEDITYIRGLYDILYDWEYESPQNISEYRYNITLKLK